MKEFDKPQQFLPPTLIGRIDHLITEMGILQEVPEIHHRIVVKDFATILAVVKAYNEAVENHPDGDQKLQKFMSTISITYLTIQDIAEYTANVVIYVQEFSNFWIQFLGMKEFEDPIEQLLSLTIKLGRSVDGFFEDSERLESMETKLLASFIERYTTQYHNGRVENLLSLLNNEEEPDGR